MFLCGVLFIPEVFGIRHSFPKFLVLAEALPFSLAFQKEIKNVETCSASAAWQGTGSPVRPSCLHASPFMEVILYQKEGFFSFKWEFFLKYVRSHANVSLENGWMHREPSSYEVTQPPARLETPFYG